MLVYIVNVDGNLTTALLYLLTYLATYTAYQRFLWGHIGDIGYLTYKLSILA